MWNEILTGELFCTMKRDLVVEYAVVLLSVSIGKCMQQGMEYTEASGV